MGTNFYLTVALIWAVAAITPGPNFFITAQTAMSESLRKSLFTVLGIVYGTLVWAISGYLGVVVIFKTVPVVYICLKLVGGLYLIYLGILLLFQKNKKKNLYEVNRSKSATSCFCQGALTNMLNPKTAAFMTSLYAVALPPDHSFGAGGVSVILICSISAIWYSLVATLFSKKAVRRGYDNYKMSIERFAGGLFVFFGLKLAISK